MGGAQLDTTDLEHSEPHCLHPFATAVDAHFHFQNSTTSSEFADRSELDEYADYAEEQGTDRCSDGEGETVPLVALNASNRTIGSSAPFRSGSTRPVAQAPSTITLELQADPELKELMREVAANRIPDEDRWMLFEQLGSGPTSIIPRLLLLWIIGLPVLVARILAGAVFAFLALGLPSMIVVGTTTAGSITFQAGYRDALRWAKESNELQKLWDTVATVLTLMLSIFVYALRLWTEIHNGLCPIFALFFDVLYELLRQLTVRPCFLPPKPGWLWLPVPRFWVW